MKKFLKIIKNNYMYLLLFLFVIIWNLFLCNLNTDEVWNYGFAHNIYSGLIPYKDFNMVITPLYPMIVSFFFLVLGSNILVINIVNALMIVHMFYLLNKLGVHNKMVILLFLCFPLTLLFPSYNLFLLYLFVLLVYFEKKKSNDYLIGVLIASIILTKQTVGFFFLMATILLLYKDKKRMFKRLFSCLSVLSVFLFYLLLTKSLKPFVDLCFLGLFDFSRSNGNYFNFLFYLSILLFCFFLFRIIKNPQDYTYLYLLCFMVNVIPLFDLYHFNLLIIASVIILFMKRNIDFRININLIIVVIIFCLSFSSFKNLYNEESIYPNKIPKFNYRYLSPENVAFTKEVNKKIKEYKNQKIIIVGSEGYYFKLINNKKIDKYDLINMGNNGYNGERKLVLDIKKMNNAIFFVDENELGEYKQTNQELLKYIINHGTKIDKVWKYTIYQL